jgi:FtsP/CotA-like multicopper oxidase with cupredoxin domain
LRHNEFVLRTLLLALGVALAFAAMPAMAQAKTIHYWIAAVPATWNVMPTGLDPITGTTFPAPDTTMETVLYKRFTRNWGSPTRNLPYITGDNDGIPGPTIRARVGDDVVVHFKNMDTRFHNRHSMHFHAFKYGFGSDGSYIPGVSSGGANVAVGRSWTYRLRAVKGSRGVWPYHDHSSSMTQSMDGGMYGAISILGKHEPKPDRENIAFLMSHLGFMTINGRAYPGNVPTLKAKVGDMVQWDVLALGSEHHTFHLHGHRWRQNGEWIDTKTLGPAESFRFRIREDVRGTWFYHCHVESHMMAGMMGYYKVTR